MAAPSTNPGVSVIVPTFREQANIAPLLSRIDAVRREHHLDIELLLMDDQSNDGTAEAVVRLNHPWVKLIERTGTRGLSVAVLEGLRTAKHDVLLVMDADLSHPPEKIPQLVQRVREGAEFVIGSRYVPGASTDETWGVYRWLTSKIATLMARPLTRLRDPMAGFFALPRHVFERGRGLNPVGYKIGLELLVKCRCTNIAEVPIHFSDRVAGRSKLDFREQLRYVRHLCRLYAYRFPIASSLMMILVGAVVGFGVWLLKH